VSRTRIILVALFLLVFRGLVGGAIAGVLDVTWAAPTTNTDGSPLTSLDTYRVYYSSGTSTPCPGSAPLTVSGSGFSGATVTFTLTGLTEHTVYYVSIAAVSRNGNVSSCSQVAFAPARPDPLDAAVRTNVIPDAVNPVAVNPVNAQVLLDMDSFADMNGQALAAYSANWPVFANWNQLAIHGSPGFGPGVGGGQANRRDGHAWTDNQWAEIVVGPGFIGDELFVGLRATDTEPAGRAYGGGYSWDGGYQIRRWDPNGTSTVLRVDPAKHYVSPGDVINVQIVGSTITLTVSRGGAPLITLSATDSRYLTGGTPMLWIACYDNNTQRYGGSWRAGRMSP
jgi:plastocyanin